MKKYGIHVMNNYLLVSVPGPLLLTGISFAPSMDI